MKKILLQLAFFIMCAIAAHAQAPQRFNYQGVARSTAGTPLASTAIGLRLTIHDGSTVGPTVYQETHAVTTNAFGLYNVAVGGGTVTSGTFSGISWGSGSKYLEVEIDPAGGSAYASVGNNQLLSVPYAMYAASSGSGGGGGVTSIATSAPLTGGPITTTGTIGMSPSGVTSATYGSATTVPQITVDVYGRVTSATNVTITGSGVTGSGTTNFIPKFTSASAIGNSQFFDNGTSVGLGTATPAASNKLQVVFGGTGSSDHAIHAISGSVSTVGGIPLNAAVWGETNTGVGVVGSSSLNYGVMGFANGLAGVYGSNIATNGRGVWGRASGTNGVGGEFDGGTSGYGLIVSAGNSGLGTATPGAKLHVNGSANTTVILGGGTFDHNAMVVQTTTSATSAESRAIVAYAANSTLENHGVYAFAAGNGSSYNVGIFAVGAPTVSSTGNSYGAYGYASGGANNYGIYGDGAGIGYAGYFNGPIYATSSSSGVKSFKIDHPADPANKYLYHSSVESNDMMNIYNGNVTTDSKGDAVVALPSYFSMLNKEYKYQLTCIGQFAQAIVSEEVTGNQFKIKTDKPNVKVSWQIAGVRQDPVANAYRIKVEVDKPASEKGTYLTPEVYGQSREKTLGYLKDTKHFQR